MIDPDALVRSRLVAQASIGAVLSSRVYASAFLPRGYKITDGPSLVFMVRGGGQDNENDVVFRPSYQFRFFAETEALARAAEDVVHAVKDKLRNQFVKTVIRELMPQTSIDTITGWPYCIVYYTFIISKKS